MNQETERQTPPSPIPLAFLLCDQVISDATTRKKTIIGVFDRIEISQFPAQYGPVSVYARLVAGEGHYKAIIEVVRLVDLGDENAGRMEGDVEVRGGTNMELGVQFPFITLHGEGRYEARLWLNDRYIHRFPFVVLQRQVEQRSQP